MTGSQMRRCSHAYMPSPRPPAALPSVPMCACHLLKKAAQALRSHHEGQSCDSAGLQHQPGPQRPPQALGHQGHHGHPRGAISLRSPITFLCTLPLSYSLICQAHTTSHYRTQRQRITTTHDSCPARRGRAEALPEGNPASGETRTRLRQLPTTARVCFLSHLRHTNPWVRLPPVLLSCGLPARHHQPEVLQA